MNRRNCAPVFVVLAAAVSLAAASARAENKIRSLTGVIVGHSVGGVTIDLVGNVYVADFGDLVWRITPEGERIVFATGLYGASGNAIDKDGNLLQSSCYGNSITKVDRNGRATPFVTGGLSCPVGIAVRRETGDAYVADCSSNSIVRVAPDGAVSTFARSPFFRCPNGVAFDRGGDLYVANFRDNHVLRVDSKGTVAPFAEVSKKGLGHLCFKDDRLYVTAYASHELYVVAMDGTAKRILGTGERGTVDGVDARARLSFPNGIACDPWAPRLYINESLDASGVLPRRAIVRVVELDGK